VPAAPVVPADPVVPAAPVGFVEPPLEHPKSSAIPRIAPIPRARSRITFRYHEPAKRG